MIAGAIPENLWPEIVLAETLVKNLRLADVLRDKTLWEARKKTMPDLIFLRILGSTVYILIHEEERAAKSGKFAARAKKGMLIGYNRQTIYRVFIEKDQKVIHVKDLRIFEDAKPKEELHLVYEGEEIDEQGGTNGDSLLMPPQSEQADKGSSIPHTKRQEPNGQSPAAQVSQRRGHGRPPISKKSPTILIGPSELGLDRSTPPESNALQR